MKKTDVFIKDEGYADIRLQSDRIKLFCHNQGFYNDLEQFDSWGGEPIWSSETKKGAFKMSVERYQAREVVELFKENGFNVESEFRWRD